MGIKNNFFNKRKYEESNENNNDTEYIKNNRKKVFKVGTHIYIRSDITTETVNKLCNFIDDINREYYYSNRDYEYGIIKPKPIYVHITSNGGELLAGYMAYDYIKNSHIPVYTVAEGYTVSAGSIIFMAGAKRFMTQNSYFLVHQLSSGIIGKYNEIKDEHTNCEAMMERLYNIYLDNVRYSDNIKKYIKLTKDILKQHMTHDLYWDLDTCYNYGLVDEIYTNIIDCDTRDIYNINNNMFSNTKHKNNDKT